MVINYYDEFQNVSFSEKSETDVNKQIKEINVINAKKIFHDEKYFHNGILDLSVFENLKIIDDYAFENCSIKTIIFPKNIEYIGIKAFANNGLNQKDYDFSKFENLVFVDDDAFGGE